MKLTQKQLRQIIQEEIRNVTEVKIDPKKYLSKAAVRALMDKTDPESLEDILDRLPPEEAEKLRAIDYQDQESDGEARTAEELAALMGGGPFDEMPRLDYDREEHLKLKGIVGSIPWESAPETSWNKGWDLVSHYKIEPYPPYNKDDLTHYVFYGSFMNQRRKRRGDLDFHDPKGKEIALRKMLELYSNFVKDERIYPREAEYKSKGWMAWNEDPKTIKYKKGYIVVNGEKMMVLVAYQKLGKKMGPNPEVMAFYKFEDWRNDRYRKEAEQNKKQNS